MFRSDNEGSGSATTAPGVAGASSVLENVGLAAAFLACAIGLAVVFSQPLGTVASEDEPSPVMLVSVHW